jgi:hypothetical protein
MEDFKETSEGAAGLQKKRHSRRWFKGIGAIMTGAAMTIGDILLVSGVLDLPVSSETRSWGVIGSCSLGVGTMITGYGELRGE